MAVLNKKNRMVSFRLSGVEYAAAQKSCSEHGVRSVSSLARDATLRVAKPELTRSGTAEAEILLQLQHQVLWLRAEMDKLSSRLIQE